MSRYDEHDIKAIINRAAELQQRSEGRESIPAAPGKLTLEDIEEIAREAGVSPDYVREAALEYEGIPVEEPLFLDTGSGSELEVIGHARGDMDKKTWAELRSIIEYHFDCPGKSTRRPEGIIWQARPKGIMKYLASRKSPRVEVKSDGNRTSIRIRKSVKTTQKLYIPALLSLGTALFFLFMAFAEEVGLLFGTLAFGALAEVFRRWAKRRIKNSRKELESLVQNLQTIVTRRHRASLESSPEPGLDESAEKEQDTRQRNRS